MMTKTEIQAFIRAEIGSDFEWACRRCGNPIRRLTQAEAVSALTRTRMLLLDPTVADTEVVMHELEWLCETNQRASIWDNCTCHPIDKLQLPREGFYVYRLWDSDRTLLYVGSSRNLRARLSAHRRRIGPALVDVTYDQYPDEASMHAAEKAVIRSENPALNVIGVSAG